MQNRGQAYTFFSVYGDCVRKLIEADALASQPSRRRDKALTDKKLSRKEFLQLPFTKGHDIIEIKDYKQGEVILADLLKQRTVKKGPMNDNSSRQHLGPTFISLKDGKAGTLTIYDMCGAEKTNASNAPIKESVTINQHNNILLNLLRDRYLTGNVPSSIPGCTYKTEMSPVCFTENKLIIVPHFDLDDNFLVTNKFILTELSTIIKLRDNPNKKAPAQRINRSSSI